MTITESTVEKAALAWFKQLGYDAGYAPEVAESLGRKSPGEVFLWDKIRLAVSRLNPGANAEIVVAILSRLERTESQDIMRENHQRTKELGLSEAEVALYDAVR